MVMPSPSEEEVFAIERCAAAWLHHSLVLPATGSHGALRVTYAVAGPDDKDVPTVLFVGGMFGGRWMALYLDFLAKKMGIKVICLDRPGMGGSTPVELKQRVAIWLETIPVLLKQLGIERVALVSHSCGSIYLLNTLLHLPHILSPTKPYVALLAPWVHPAESHVSMMSLVGYIPNSVLAHWNQIIKGILSLRGSKITTTIGTSSDAFSAITSIFSSSTNDSEEELERKTLEFCGISHKKLDKLVQISQKCIFAEDTTGGNDEAMLCLKKMGPGLWGACEEYDKYLPVLVQQLKSTEGREARLKVQAYYAEEDVMIGKGGQAYFVQNWSSSQFADAIDFESFTNPKTNHESICDPTNGVMAKIFEEVKKSFE